ncbi:hypothetical protein EV424DRAFT_1354776 [Suillus variegatus]|nr:hypothetical protein EV424DRAFT_1354776 [Suillus variegatus]
MSDMAEVHLFLERIHMESDERIGRIETDVSNVKHSLQQTIWSTDSTSSQLQHLEDVVASNQAHLENIFSDMCCQLSSVQQDIASSDVKLQYLERIGKIESSVLAFHDVMAKSLDHHREILKYGSILYQKLSQEVADMRVEIGDIVAGLCQHISMFQESTKQNLDYILIWAEDPIWSVTTFFWYCQVSNICTGIHTVVNTFRVLQEHGAPPSGHVVGLLVMVAIIFIVVNFWFAEGPTELMTATSLGGQLMWQSCRDIWGNWEIDQAWGALLLIGRILLLLLCQNVLYKTSIFQFNINHHLKAHSKKQESEIEGKKKQRNQIILLEPGSNFGYPSLRDSTITTNKQANKQTCLPRYKEPEVYYQGG